MIRIWINLNCIDEIKYNENLSFRIRVWIDWICVDEKMNAIIWIMWQDEKESKNSQKKIITKQADTVVKKTRSKTRSKLYSWTSREFRIECEILKKKRCC